MDSGLLQELMDFAAARTRAFEAMNAVSLSGGAVHTVAPIEWLAGVEIPGAACHTAVLGGELARLKPTSAAVTCQKCLPMLGVAVDSRSEHPVLAGLDSLNPST